MTDEKNEKPKGAGWVILGAAALVLGLAAAMTGLDGLRGGTMLPALWMRLAALIGGAIFAVGGAALVVFGCGKLSKKDTARQAALAVCEGAIMVALAQVLALVKLWEMPQGGSISLAMLPICVFAVRWGLGKGLLAAFVFSLLQLFLDGAYAWGWQSIIGDYLLAFTALGLAGLGHKRPGGIFWGSLVGCMARYLLHYVTGATVWAEYMPEVYCGMDMSTPWVYSLLYNGVYMLPCTALVLVVVCLLNRPMRKYWNGADMGPLFGFYFGGGTAILMGAAALWYSILTWTDKTVHGPAWLIALILGAILVAGGFALVLAGLVKREDPEEKQRK